MIKNISLIKGIHPGVILERELKKRDLTKSRFAISVNEFPQTLVAITKGKRKMNTTLALRIENALGIEEGFFMILQVYHEIEQAKNMILKQHNNDIPDLKILRSVLFWDTKMEKINWIKHKKAVIKRVFERGNENEKNEIIRFYGEETVNHVLKENEK